jgi:hypothetical protein
MTTRRLAQQVRSLEREVQRRLRKREKTRQFTVTGPATLTIEAGVTVTVIRRSPSRVEVDNAPGRRDPA